MRRPGFLMMAALAALILGFLARRMMIPSAAHYLAHRPSDRPQSAGESNQPAADSGQGDADDPAAEHLTPGDRSELDSVIKRKGK